MGITGLEMADLVREVCYDMGRGRLRLDGAMAGYRAFTGAVGEGAAFPYVIIGTGEPLQWEAGTGRIDVDGRLVRGPVASSADGAAVDFAAGEKRVGLAVHAGWIAAMEAHGHGVGDVEGLAEALAGRQAASGELDAIAGLTGAAFGRSLLTQGSAEAARSSIGALGNGGVQRMNGAELHVNALTGSDQTLENWMGKMSVMAPAMSLVMDGGQASFRVVAAGGLANNRLYRINGTLAARTDVMSNDVIGDYSCLGLISGSFTELSRIRTTYVATSPGSTNLASRMSFQVGRNGSASMQEALRLEYQALTAFGAVAPSSDNGFALGGAAARWSTVYAASGTISTSDARAKQDVAAVDDALLDAWGTVAWRWFRFGEAVAAKGAAARWHVGLVAQEVRNAIDARLGEGAAVRLGLLCHDAWDAAEDVAAGDRWGLRYEECLALEAAWQRRRMAGIEARLDALEAGDGAG
ncbi:tail fiber domain-containing protein [Sphingobium sp.]|uniref:tail fiber domain-containing protein n=1 Tax=Sphingobium sp. TaxID=1912891 RepID=UPI002BCD8552|nr:tail fiber domain-containing protein [Sphingobium sp.]HUD93423.1 tail fiber domain-containing protein [Sphingobium sp.]